ncbi:hypothetical protein ABGV42_00105 [Paenibacillus pabuli]|uniref:hypothetical protein n=1 Tax=Paenibacillus pabuli TaxID=1472 RepID=UPI00324277C6
MGRKSLVKRTLAISLSAVLLSSSLGMNLVSADTSVSASATDVQISLTPTPNVDVVLTVGENNWDVANFSDDLKSRLKAKGVNTDKLNITSVEQKEVSAKDSFAWQRYSHNFSDTAYAGATSDTGYTTDHIVSNGKKLTFYGYDTYGYRDFMLMPDSTSGKKTFTFDLNEAGIQYHSMQGGGFLFNVKSEGGLISGYVLLYEESGIRLYQIANASITSLRDMDTSSIGNIPGVTQITTFAKPFGTNHSVKIEVTPQSLDMWDNGTQIVKSYALPQIFGNSFGPIASYVPHACTILSYFTFENLQMQMVSAKQFKEVIRQPSWRTDAEHFVVNLENKVVADFDNAEASGEILTRLTNAEIDYVALGSTTNQAQAQAFIQRNNNDGTFINNSNYASAMDQLAEYIYSKIKVDPVSGTDTKYVLVGEPIDINVSPSSLATNSQTTEYPQGRWRIDHDYNYFENSLGQASWAGQWQKNLQMVFDKPGKYDIAFGDMHPSPQYIIAHRRPIAAFDLKVTAGTSAYTVTTTDKSYDPDSQSAADKGIAQVEWSWKEATAVNWTQGKIPSSLPLGKAYVIQLRVLDKQGAWSKYESRYITTSNTDAKPVASFDLPSQATKYDIVKIADNSYDPGGKGITETAWRIEKDGTAVYSGATPINSFKTYGEGKYTVYLKVKNGSGTWSDEYSSSITITDDLVKPEASFELTRQDWTNKNIGFTVNFTDAGGSGFASQRYAVTQSPNFPTTGFSAWSTNSSQYIQITTDGIWYVHVEAKDGAGNVLQKTMGDYRLDKTPPAKPVFVPSTTTKTNKDYDMAITFSEDSVTKQYRLDGGDWLDYTSPFLITKNGLVEARATDLAGNTTAIETMNITNIKKTPPAAATFSAAVDPVNGNVIVGVKYPEDVVTREYRIGLDWVEYTAPVVMTDNGIVYTRSVDAYGNYSPEAAYVVDSIDRTPPDDPVVTASKTELTNTDLEISIGYADDSVLNEYRIGDGDWRIYSGTIKVTENVVISARARDKAGNVTPIIKYEVTNIKKTIPEPPTLSADVTTITSGDVEVTVNFPVDAVKKQYQIAGETEWIDYTGPIMLTANATVVARAIDGAGNIGTSSSLPVFNIKKTGPADATFSADNGSLTSPMNRDIVLVANFPDDAVVKEYQMGDSNSPWLPYTGPITVTENTTVSVRSKDAAGNPSKVNTVVISNIDKVAPDKATFTPDKTELTSQAYGVTINYPSDSALSEYKLSTTGSSWSLYRNPINVNDNVTIYARSRDLAGNISEVATYDVTNFVKNTQTTAPVLTPSITVPTGQTVYVDVKFPTGATIKEYRVDGGAWQEYTGAIEVLTNALIEARSTDAVGNVSPIGRVIVSNISKTPPANATFAASKTTPTNQDVIVTIGYPTNAVVKEYKVNDGEWRPYTAGVNFTENGTIYARSTDALGNVSDVSTYSVTNITKTTLLPPILVADNTNATNGNVKVVVTYPTGTVTKEYRIDNGPWMTYTGPITLTTNGVVQARATDAAGNVSVAGSLTVDNISKSTPKEPIIMPTLDTTPTAGPIYVPITFPSNAVVKQCRINGGAWFDYTGPIEMTDNGTITCRYQDASGNWSADYSLAINHIVKTTPSAPYLYANNAVVMTNKSVFVTITYPSGTKVSEYRIDGGAWQNYIKPIEMKTNGKVEARATNYANVYSPISDLTVSNILKTGPDKAIITADITEPTSGKVNITITYPDNVALKEYHIGETGGMWITYHGQFPVSNNLTVYARSRDDIGNYSEVASYVVNNIQAPTVNGPMINADKTLATNTDVTISINYSSASTKREYRLNGGTWQSYTSPFAMTANGTVEAREVTGSGQESGISIYSVTNIDKTPPADATFVADKTIVSDKVAITINYPADATVKQYRIGENGDYLTYAQPISVTANTKIYAKSRDAVGNWSNVTSYEVTNISNDVPTSPTFFLTPGTATDGPVTVTITYPAGVTWKQYRIDGGAWQNYYNPVVVKTNGTVIEARGMDSKGTMSNVSKVEVTNITSSQSSAPTFSADTVAITGGNVNVTINYPSNAFTKQYKIGETGVWQNYYGTVVMTDNGKLYARYLDTTGSYSTESVYTVTNIDKVPPNMPGISANTYAPTTGNVVVSIIYPSDSVANEYMLGTGIWVKYSGPLVVSENVLVSARATDAVGNVSQVAILNVTNIGSANVGTPAGSSMFVPDIIAPTTGVVRFTINYPSDALLKQYRIGENGVWQTYYYSAVVDSNTTIYARSMNKTGLWSEITSYEVTNIIK